MRIVSKAELEEREIEHLKALADVSCSNVSCYNCPLNINVRELKHVCIKNLAGLCLARNNINPHERS